MSKTERAHTYTCTNKEVEKDRERTNYTIWYYIKLKYLHRSYTNINFVG